MLASVPIVTLAAGRIFLPAAKKVWLPNHDSTPRDTHKKNRLLTGAEVEALGWPTEVQILQHLCEDMEKLCPGIALFPGSVTRGLLESIAASQYRNLELMREMYWGRP